MAGDEPLSGTAISAKQYIFITWPKIFWARNQYESYKFPNTLKDYLQKLQAEKQIVTRLVDSKDHFINEGLVDFFIMPDGIKYQAIPIDKIENVISSYLSGDHESSISCLGNNNVYVFCCTHGKRDKCCAKFGFAVVNEFKAISKQKNLNYNVWECTHIGADRLAATAMIFPYGYMYGRIRKENVADIVHYFNKGYPYPPCFRGQLGLDSIAQTIESHGHQYWFDNGIDNAQIIVQNIAETAQGQFIASLVVQDKVSKEKYTESLITLEKKSFTTYIDCNDVDSGVKKTVSRWVIAKSEIVS